MRKIWQQDVLRYLTNRQQKKGVEDPGLPFGLLLPLKNVRLELDLGADDSKLSNFVNRKKNTPYTCGFDAEQVFDTLIQPLLDEGRITEESALRNFHEFLWAEGIEDSWKDIDDYRSCIVAAMREGLQRLRPQESKESGPALRPQRLQPSPFFAGREQDLETVRKVLSSEGTVILSGIGGMGKTSLAEEYARRQGNTYSARQIVSAEPGYTSYKDLILAVRLSGVPDAGGSPEEILQRKIEQLCALDASSLLIFDNLNTDLDDYGLMRRLLRESGAHIIVTTRMHEAFPEGTELQVGPLSPEEQLLLFERSMDRPVREAEGSEAQAILERIGGHTLLIQLLGRAARRQTLPVGELLEKLQGLHGFAALESAVRIQKDGYNKTGPILAFIRELLFNLGPLSEEEREVMRYLTLLPLDGVSAGVLEAEPFSLPERAIATLSDNNWLILSDDGRLRMHPVIREAVLAELEVTSHSCTPFLYALDQLLWEPEVSEHFAELLRLASSAVDTLYIRDDLRRLLTGSRLNPLFQQVYDLAQGQSLWGRLEETLSEAAQDPELTALGAETLQLYASFCALNSLLDRGRPGPDDPAYAAPFLDKQQILESIYRRGDRAAFEAAQEDFMSRFVALRASEPELQTASGEPQICLEEATALIAAELTEYLQEAGFFLSPDGDPDAVASIFSVLSTEDLQLLETVSHPAYNSFLETALEAFSASQALLPFTASTAVFMLTNLFVLQQLSCSQIHSLEDVASIRGWAFPQIGYVPAGFGQPVDFAYREPLWGRPEVEIGYAQGRKALHVSVCRPDREQELDSFTLTETETVESTEQRTIRLRTPVRRGQADVEIEMGPWRMRIQGLKGLSRKEALQMARSVTTPDGGEGR